MNHVNSKENKKRLRKARSVSEQLRVRHGKLSEKNICELLFFAYTTQMDGSITCSKTGVIKSLRFKSGALIEAKSNDPHDSSIWILHEMGKLDGGFQQDASSPNTGNTMRLLSEQIQKGVMQPGDIDEFVHRRVRRILHDLMSWEDGDYLLELTKTPQSEPTLKVHRSIPEMIMREIKVAPDPVGLSQLMENPGILVEPTTSGNDYRAAIKLTAVEQRILRAIRKPMTLRDLAMREGMGLEILARIMLGFNALGLVRVRIPHRVKHSSYAGRQRHAASQPAEKSTPKAKPAPKYPEPQMQKRVGEKTDTVEDLETDEISEFELVGEFDDEEVSHEIFTAEEALSFLKEFLQRGFQWDPFVILGLDSHAGDDEIEKTYRKLYDKIIGLRKFPAKDVQEHMASALALLEESRTILVNVTLRKRFSQISKLVDVHKKILLAAQEHKKGLQAFKDKRLPLAIVHIKFSAYLDPRNSEYCYKLIYMMAQSRRLWAFARMLQEYSLENFGTNAHIIALSGLLYHRAGDKTRARMEYNRALKINPEHEIARQGITILDKSFNR